VAALTGVRVVDFTQNLPGPYTTMVLRSMGAEVIKVEPPRGDTARIFPRLFDILNAGKHSVRADLREEETRSAVKAMIGEADVVVEGFRPGVMERFGLGPDAIREAFPKVVYCSISGFGQDGPYRDMPGHDLNFQALTGVCHMLRDDRERPLGGALPFGDLSAAMTATTAILGALLERERTGQGQVLDVAMVDALLSWTYVWSEGLSMGDTSLADAAEPTAAALRRAGEALPGALGSMVGKLAGSLERGKGRATLEAVGERLRKTKRVRSLERLRLHTLPHYTVYRTADARYLSIGVVDEDKFWKKACEVLDLSGAGGLPLWGRFLAAAPLRSRIAARIREQPLEFWVKRFKDAGVPAAPVLTVDEALEDIQLRTRRPVAGHVRGPWSIGEPVDAPVPRLGEHNAAFLK
jgi:crotonobetainyl-CoA:carnitine CoA-transferase CaiB-like acyl-CoA transferase